MNGNNNKKGFLKRLDAYLLIHRPVTWSSRIHAVLCYGLSFTLIVSLIAFATSNDARANAPVYNWVILLSVISILAFIFWMIYLLRFNVFKRYGKWGRFDSLKTFVLYFLIITLFVSWPFIPLIFQSARANMAYTSAELVKDINDMNVKLCLLERDSINMKFNTDTIEFSSDVSGSRQKTGRDAANDYTVYSDNYYLLDSASFANRLSGADSIFKIGNSVYVVYKCPDYQFVSTYQFPDNIQGTIMTSMDLYYTALERKVDVNKKEVRGQLDLLLKKYMINAFPDTHPEYYDYEVIPYTDNSFSGRLSRIYGLGEVNSSLSNIAEKKYRWDNDFIGIAIRVVYYIGLFTALLVFVYRHTTRKVFFLSLLSGVVISILTALLIAVSYSGSDYSLGWYLFYFAIFSFLSAMIFVGKRRDAIFGIALNLAVFMVVFVPLTIVSLRYKYLHELYYISNKYQNADYSVYNRLFENEDFHYLLAEIGGFVLLLLLMATIIQKAYRRWYASPEQ